MKHVNRTFTTRLTTLVAALSAGLLSAGAVQAQAGAFSDGIVKIGVLTDLSGVYSDVGGKGSIIAAEMAVKDFGGTLDGVPIEVVSADHQSKADEGALVARTWFDREQVDTIVGMNNSSVALAVVNIAKADNRIVINTGAGTTALTNESCAPTSIHYNYDTYALSHGTAKYVVKNGGDSWYFVTADYSFGKQLEKDATAVIKQNGGKVLGSARHPINTSDFSSYLLSAQASGARIVGLANAGKDTINAIKTAHQFGVTENQDLAGLLVFIQDIHSLGLDVAKGLYITTGFYWDRNDETRAWSKRFYEQAGKMPSVNHAATYSATLHYLRAVQAAKTDGTDAVNQQMRAAPVDDFYSRGGVIRPDGRMIHDMYLVQVKSPAESKYPWDYYKVVATIPQDDAFMPLSESTCALLKQ